MSFVQFYLSLLILIMQTLPNNLIVPDTRGQPTDLQGIASFSLKTLFQYSQ
jgi:hypothetical protein